MKYLHIIQNSVFTKPFIEFINNNFNPNDHLFMIEDDLGFENSTLKNVQVIPIRYRWDKNVLRAMYHAEKIFFHGLFSNEPIIILTLHPNLLKKSNWLIWGWDLYKYINNKNINNNFKFRIMYYMYKNLIRNIGGLITHVKGDYELAKELYGAKGKYYYSFMYPSNLYHEYDISKVNKKESNVLNIQVGNSADPSNNHLEVLHKLECYKYEDIEIICPLSYGNKNHRDRIIEEGNKIYGEKFIPLTEFMPFDEYLKLLAKVDVAIFNHKRQQAMGNITTLLGLGKKVYIRDDITTWDFCIDHGLKVYSSNKGLSDLFNDMDKEDRQKNIHNVRNCFSKEKLFKDWNNIFTS